jgi:hypothetical protein
MKKPEGKNLRDSPFKDEQRRNAPFLDLIAGLHEGAVIFTFFPFLEISILPCLSWDPRTQKLHKKNLLCTFRPTRQCVDALL